ncbi:MAG: bile acid:sodium symporter family protein [Verrucomicrobia bacterium]|nr:bile acid:sodium symporter family protein [Verrucomicrobiota bacterium]
MLQRFTALYPVWIVASSVMALIWPDTLRWFSGPWVVWALSIVMLSMGLTLTVDDFRRLGKMPGAVALGFALQYTIMPLAGWSAGRLCALEPGLAVGLILVASCPGGTASNLITYLARANVALSVVMTMVSTLLAFIMTPLWCEVLAGQYVPVDAWGLCRSTLQVVVLPVLIGVFCNWKFPRQIAGVARFSPAVSVVAIIFIAGGIVAQSAESVIAHAGRVAIAVLLVHLLGFGLGYVIARALRFPIVSARTISIEVGMQNGGMAAMLARKHFASQPMAGVPAVFSSVLQTLVGSLLAAWWSRRPMDGHAGAHTARKPVAPVFEGNAR